jgi:molecular chaperone DnaK
VAEIKRLSEALTQTSHKLAEAIYQQSAQKEQAAGGGEAGAGPGAAGKSASDDDVVDADFEEVKGDKK